MVRDATRAGRLPCIRVGKHMRFTRPMLEEWAALHRIENAHVLRPAGKHLDDPQTVVMTERLQPVRRGRAHELRRQPAQPASDPAGVETPLPRANLAV